MVRLKSEYTSAVKNYRMSTEGKTLESIQRKFVALFQNRFFTNDHADYENLQKYLKLRTLHNSRVYLDALFFISVYLGLKYYRSLLAIAGIRVLHLYFSNSSLFVATCNNTPSARSIGAANLHVNR